MTNSARSLSKWRTRSVNSTELCATWASNFAKLFVELHYIEEQTRFPCEVEIPLSRSLTWLFFPQRLLDKTKVTCVKWVPGSTQQFLVGFASGQLLHCDDSLPWSSTLPSYQAHKHGDGFAVYTCKSRTPRNPVYRWTIGEGSLDAFAFSPCSKFLATASHDGFLRVFLFETFDLIGT